MDSNVICAGAVLQSPDADRIVVVLHVGGPSMGPIHVGCWQSWVGRSMGESIPLVELKDAIDKGALVPASGAILALGLKCFEMHTTLMAKVQT